MSYPPRPGEPGYHDHQYDRDQAREMEREAAAIQWDRMREIPAPADPVVLLYEAATGALEELQAVQRKHGEAPSTAEAIRRLEIALGRARAREAGDFYGYSEVV